MINMSLKGLALVFVLFVQLLLALLYEYDIVSWGLLLVNLLGTFFFFRTIRSFAKNISILFLFVFIFCSLNIEALAKFQASSINSIFVIPEGANESVVFHDLAVFSNEVLAVYMLSYMLLGRVVKYRKRQFEYLHKSTISDVFFDLAIIIAFFFSIISGILGVGKMGYEASVVLPFHLNGIMQFFRTDIFPIIICVFVYDHISKKRIIKNRHILLIVVWAFLESVVRLSRSAAVMSFVPLLLMFVYSNYFTKRTVIRTLLPLLCAAFLMFPVISALRDTGDVSLQNISSSKEEKKENANQHMYLRTFYSGIYFIRIFSSGYDDPSMFYFGRLPLIIFYGGSAVYTTREVDGVSERVVHSSGTTGILDPLLIGGKGLCFVTVFFLVLIALIIDRKIGNDRILIKIVCLMFFKILVMSKNLTILLDTEFFQLLTSYLAQFAIIGMYYKKYFIRKLI